MFERNEITFKGFPPGERQTFESNVGYDLRFMIDTNVRAAKYAAVKSDNLYRSLV
jgi:hypothetical protein